MSQRPSSSALAEIAKLTGLSQASVRAALSGRGGNTRVSPETIRRVQEVADRLNYHYRANAGAQAMRSRRFNNIGFLLVNKEFHDYSFSDFIMQGLTPAATEHNQSITLIRIPTELDRTLKLPRPLTDSCLDGLIVQDSAQLTPEFVALVESYGVPVVYLNEKRPTNAVYVDDVTTGRIMTEFLLAKGYRRISLLAPMVRVPHYSTTDRIEGYRTAMENAKLPAEVKRFIGSSSWEADAVDWLMSDDRPEAIFCHSDQVALVLQRVLYPLDIKVPRDIAIAGCNDEHIAAHSPIPLTTIRIPFAQMARVAVDMLMQLIDHPETPSLPAVMLKPELVKRHSTERAAQSPSASES